MIFLPNNFVIKETKPITVNYVSKEFSLNEGYRHLIEILGSGSGINFTLRLEGSVSREAWTDVPIKEGTNGTVFLKNVDETVFPISIEVPTSFPFMRIVLEDVSGAINNFRVSLSRKS